VTARDFRSVRPTSGPSPVVAITGARGYLGSVLVAAFGDTGCVVRPLVRAPVAGSSDRYFDLRTAETAGALDDVDILVHCAYDMTLTGRADIWQVNVLGSVALLDQAAAAGVPRTLVVSSMSAYRGTRQLYGRSKLAVEVAARARGMCVVRPGLVYGPGWGGMAGTLRRLAGLPVLPDFGHAARQFTVSQDDFASAMVALAAAEGVPSVPVGIAHPEAIGFAQLLTAFAASAGHRAPRFVPVPPTAAYGMLRALEVLRVRLPVRADSLLGLSRPALEVPNPDIAASLGVAVQPFALERAGGAATAAL
jgi:nucleoside-diphosphate-sugar epimerase